LHSLYRICGRRALLPKSLVIPLCYNPTDTPQCHGGFADVWKGRYHGREVAAKALRVSPTSDFERIRKVGYPRLVVFINKFTGSRTEVLQEGCSMENLPPSERVAAGRCDDDREPVRGGV